MSPYNLYFHHIMGEALYSRGDEHLLERIESTREPIIRIGGVCLNDYLAKVEGPHDFPGVKQ
jgi:hypothetical protein